MQMNVRFRCKHAKSIVIAVIVWLELLRVGALNIMRGKNVNMLGASSEPQAVNACEPCIIHRDVSVTGSYIEHSVNLHEKNHELFSFCSSLDQLKRQESPDHMDAAYCADLV